MPAIFVASAVSIGIPGPMELLTVAEIMYLPLAAAGLAFTSAVIAVTVFRPRLRSSCSPLEPAGQGGARGKVRSDPMAKRSGRTGVLNRAALTVTILALLGAVFACGDDEPGTGNATAPTCATPWTASPT